MTSRLPLPLLALFACLAPLSLTAQHEPDENNTEALSATVATTPVNVRIDWSRTAFTTARDAYSLNAFHNFNPAVPANADYQKNIAYMNPGALRYHSSSLVGDSEKSAKGWIDYDTRTWNVERIKAATAHWPKGPAVQITIPKWPAWMNTSPEKLLDEKFHADYAALCAQLVRIINIDLKLGVKRWEPMNERELVYVRALERNGKKSQYAQLIEIYNRCAVAMKQVDPSIQVGGPAISSAGWVDLVSRFTKGAGDNLDFFSCHLYGGNDVTAPDERIFNAAAGFGPKIRRVAEILKKEIPDRNIEIALNEFNIAWTWRTEDPRMTNHKGAVFDALAIISTLSHGGTSTYAWNDVDNIYGKMSRRYELRPSAHLYHLLNGHFVGAAAAVTSSDEKRVVPFAVDDVRTKQRAILLVNRSSAPQTVHLSFNGAPATAARSFARHEISAAGYTTVPLNRTALENGLLLPDCSVTVLLPASAE